MSGIGIICNPHSRSNLKNPQRADQLGFIVGDKGSCHETRDVKDVERLAREFKERDVEILGISGGDGTIHITLTTFIKVYDGAPLPKIAFLRGGTMNNIPNAVNVKGSPEKILSNLILKYHEDKEFTLAEIDVLNINGQYGFLFGMGAVHNFIDDYLHTDEKPSPARGMYLLSKCIISGLLNAKYARKICERFDARITVDDEVALFKNYTMLMTGTITTLGFGFHPLYRARSKPGEFQFVGISTTPRNLLFTFPYALMSRPPKSDDYFDRMGKKMLLELDQPVPYQIDGEPMPATDRIEISIGPRLTCIVS